MREQDVSTQNRITNVIATAIAIAGAIVASPAAMEKLPGTAITVLKAMTTFGNTTQPLLVTVVGIIVAGATHPPAWLAGFAHEVWQRLQDP